MKYVKALIHHICQVQIQDDSCTTNCEKLMFSILVNTVIGPSCPLLQTKL